MMSAFIWEFDPEIFRLGSFAPRWYGVCFAAAILIGYQVMRYFFRKDGKSEEMLNNGFILFVIGTVVGARLGHCLFYEPAYYLSNPLKILAVWEGGLASHGGVIGIFICMIIFARKYHKDISFIWLADRLGIACALGTPFIRLGNFFNSEIIGKPTEGLPWAVVFKSVDNIPRHPAQLYEVLSYFLVFIVLVLFYKLTKAKFREGRLIGLMFIGIFTARFFIEFIKEDQSAFEKGMILNMGQLLSIPFVALGLWFFFGGYQKLHSYLSLKSQNTTKLVVKDKQRVNKKHRKSGKKAGK